MLDAIDVTPMYEQVAYEVVPSAYMHAAKGSAAPHVKVRADAQARVTDARIHCVRSHGGQGDLAVCDDATLISLAKTPSVRPAVINTTISRLGNSRSSALQPASSATQSTHSDGLMTFESPTRRWLADLLLTAGIGFLLVSCFLFITSRVPQPQRSR